MTSSPLSAREVILLSHISARPLGRRALIALMALITPATLAPPAAHACEGCAVSNNCWDSKIGDECDRHPLNESGTCELVPRPEECDRPGITAEEQATLSCPKEGELYCDTSSPLIVDVLFALVGLFMLGGVGLFIWLLVCLMIIGFKHLAQSLRRPPPPQDDGPPDA